MDITMIRYYSRVNAAAACRNCSIIYGYIMREVRMSVCVFG